MSLPQESRAADQDAKRRTASQDPMSPTTSPTVVSRSAIRISSGWPAARCSSTPGRDPAYASAAGTAGTVAMLKLPIKSAVVGMNEAIRNQITNEFTIGPGTYFDEHLKGKYPIDLSSTECNGFRFNEYYREGGVFWTFYEEKLKTYVTPSGGPQPGSDATGAVPDAVMAQLQLAWRVRQAFYAIDPSAAKFTFTVKTSQDKFQGNSGINTPFVSFDVGGKFARYNMGPPSPLPLEWPGAQPADGANLRVQISGQASAVSAPTPGVWGLFRLVDRAQVSRQGENLVLASFRVPIPGGAIVVPYEIQTEAMTPLVREFWTH